MDHHDDWPGDHTDPSGDDLPDAPEHDPGDYDTADLSGDEHADYGGDDTAADAGSDDLDAGDLSGDGADGHPGDAPADDAGDHAGQDGAADQDAHEHVADDSTDSGEPASETFGAGLDSAGDHDGSWHEDEFPEQLALHAPEPLDGYPWTDPASLGGLGALGEHGIADVTQPVDPQDLFDYAGLDPQPGTNPWEQLLASDDPATSTLARWWGAIS